VGDFFCTVFLAVIKSVLKAPLNEVVGDGLPVLRIILRLLQAFSKPAEAYLDEVLVLPK